MVSLVPFRYHVTLLMNHFVLPQSRYVVIGNLLSNNGWAPSTVSSPGCLSTVTVCRPLPGINLYAGHGCCGDPRPSQQFLSFSNFGGDFILEWQKRTRDISTEEIEKKRKIPTSIVWTALLLSLLFRSNLSGTLVVLLMISQPNLQIHVYLYISMLFKENKKSYIVIKFFFIESNTCNEKITV